MRKILNIAFLMTLLLSLGSCSKEDIPMTSTVNLAGEWMITVDVIDGDDVYEDGYGLGQLLWITYNTNADNGKEMWLDDLGSFWETKVKIPCDPEARTFGSSTPVENAAYEDCEVTVTGGKVIPGGAVTPSGMSADAIEFYITYSDDEYEYVYYCHGYRRTGFVADDI